MNDASKEEARLLSGAELELVAVTRPPEIDRQSVDELKAAARRFCGRRTIAPGRSGDAPGARDARQAPSRRAAQRWQKTIREPSARRKLCARRSTGSKRS